MDSKVGIPSDLAPLDRSPMLTGAGLPAVSSTECCAHNQWEPIAERLQADGVTLEIPHGQRDSDWGPMVRRGLAFARQYRGNGDLSEPLYGR